MAYLLDTGVLLRFVNVQDGQHPIVVRALRALVGRRESLFFASQNVAEFCNVATRPIANNGYGWSPPDALHVFTAEIEPISSFLAEPASLHAELKRLIETYSVVGKQIHDTRLVAMMLSLGVSGILTLNDGDFRRYEPEGIHIETPATLANNP